ncbi:MAG: CPBP family intramembrane metalloprotease [archaeon GB-1867-035]|nr:CPBP family intramembrane metalloprotease [Candidatus Culexmicrobium profundum]
MNSVAWYFILVLLIGGLGYAPWVLHSYGMFPSDIFFIFILIGGASPTFAALIVSRLEFGKKGPEYLFSQFGRRDFSKLWFLVPILLSFIKAIFTVLLWSLMGGSYKLDWKSLIEFPIILFSNFLANMWEEIGWRGYALPALQRKYNALVSSLIIGIFWAVWHWPHFAIKDSVMMANYHNFLIFTIITILGSIQHTWLYNSTNGSLLIASLYHASINTVNTIFFVKGGISSIIIPFYLPITAVITILIILILKPDSLRRKPRVTFKQPS